MNSEERKEKFSNILKELLEKNCNGIQVRLAKNINISSSRVSRWIQGQADPINLDASVFARIAALKGSSSEDLAINLGFTAPQPDSKDKFRELLTEMLSNKSQEELGENLGISQIAISNWLNPEKNIDPNNISAGTIFALAHQKGWTFDELMVYLDLQKGKSQKKLLRNYQLEFSSLSLIEQIDLLDLLLGTIRKQIKEKQNYLNSSHTKNNKKVILIFENPNLSLAYYYPRNLEVYAQFIPDNIKITTVSKLPSLLKDFDLMIINIENNASEGIKLINQISFDGDIIIFTTKDLELEVRNHLKNKVTDIVVKPIDWQELKNKSYF